MVQGDQMTINEIKSELRFSVDHPQGLTNVGRKRLSVALGIVLDVLEEAIPAFCAQWPGFRLWSPVLRRFITSARKKLEGWA